MKLSQAIFLSALCCGLISTIGCGSPEQGAGEEPTAESSQAFSRPTCPIFYLPVCGVLPGATASQTFSNTCVATQAGATIISNGACMTVKGSECSDLVLADGGYSSTISNCTQDSEGETLTCIGYAPGEGWCEVCSSNTSGQRICTL